MGEDETDNHEQGAISPTSEEGNIIIAPIEVVIPHVLSDDDSDEEPDQTQKKKKKKKRGAKKADKTMILTKTFGQAIRLINEQKEREKLKQRQEEIRQMALEQK